MAYINAGIAVSQLDQCFEPGEIGPDQGCLEQIKNVVDFGDKATPFLLSLIEHQDPHLVLNVFRCLNKIKPTLNESQKKQIHEARKRISSLLDAMNETNDPATIVKRKLLKFATIEIQDFIKKL